MFLTGWLLLVCFGGSNWFEQQAVFGNDVAYMNMSKPKSDVCCETVFGENSICSHENSWSEETSEQVNDTWPCLKEERCEEMNKFGLG